MPPYERGTITDGRRGGGAQPGGRGVPDGLLIGAVGFLLGLTGLTWSATGLASWLAHGSWPAGVTFARTPSALRHLLGEPGALSAAWPDVPAEHLSGPGLFWGLLISQLMLLSVVAFFVLSAVARRRALRQARRVKAERRQDAPDQHGRLGDVRPPATAAVRRPPPKGPGRTGPTVAGRTQSLAPEPTPTPGAEAPPASAEVGAAPAGAPARSSPGAARRATVWGASGGRGLTIAAGPGAAAVAVREAAGPLVVVTADVGLWSDTAGARAKLGPVHVYDPLHRTTHPTRMRWAPHDGCGDIATARTRAAALLAPVRPSARSRDAVDAAAETMLRCWLHAAAVAQEPFRQVHRWALAGTWKEAIRVLRTSPAAAAGVAGELEATIAAHPERRDEAVALVRRALKCVSQLHVRDACTSSRSDRLAWESFAPEWGSLYVVGEALEDPHRGDPGVTPLATALTSAVVEHGRRMAARSSSGRLDPPITLVLDGPATVAPLPELPALLADAGTWGIAVSAFLRSREQLRLWWPELAEAAP